MGPGTRSAAALATFTQLELIMSSRFQPTNLHETPEAFIEDAQLIFDNCRKYNIGTTPYTKSANKLEHYMWQKLKAVPEWSHLEA